MAIDQAPAPAAETPADVTIDGGRVVVFLLAAIAVLNVANAVCIALGADTDLSRYWLLALERNPSTWFSSGLLAITGVAAFAVGRARPVDGRRWTTVAAVLGVLSLDEVATLHERLGAVPVIPGIGSRGWAGAGLLLAALVGGMLLGWARRLEAPLRSALLGGGLVFVIGAVGFEVLSGNRAESHGTDLVHWVLATIEEDLEMLGVVVVLRALLAELARSGAVVGLRVRRG